MNEFPILLLDNFFLFPKCDSYLSLESNIYWKKVLLQAWKDCQGHLIIIPNREKLSDNSEKFAPIGTLAKINLDISAETDLEPIINSLKEIQLRGLERIRITNLEKKNETWRGEYQVLPEKELDEKTLDELTEKFVRHLPDILEKSKLSSVEKLPYMTMMRGNISNLVDFIAQNSREVDRLIKWKILASLDLQERLEILINLPDRQKIEKDLEEATREEIKKEQEEYYLRQKQKIIERKLRKKGNYSSDEMRKYQARLEKEPYPDYVKKVIQEEIERYEMMPPNSSEASMLRTYIDWIVNIPWWQKTAETKDLALVRQKLDEKHYGLEEVKEKIHNYLAASWKAKEPLGKVILLYGPPGVGKTSVASSIAEALGRKFARISVAGLEDVAEIKGHRRTYIGAMPGRIIQVMKKVQVQNPLIFIDEVDKIGQHSFRGNPAYALLEVFDPQQNKKFIDYYLGEEAPYDLSNVMFICAANELRDIPEPLLERMEVINLSSYTPNQKFYIAKNYLIPNILKKYNWTTADREENQKGAAKEEKIQFSDEAIREIINHYTRESGVRGLSRKIEKIVEKFISELAENKKEKLTVALENLKEYLKKKEYFEFTTKQKEPHVGSATGLAWTGYGGDILIIEVAYYPRKEGEPEFTGNLGDIMKESCRVALSYLKGFLKDEVNQKKFGIDPKIFSENIIHIHFPEGATPKEGPSAGIALTSAIISALTGQIIPHDIGMTGEITLHGRVEAIGGLKEKAIAAHRSELKTIIIPKANEKDIEDIPLEVRQNLTIIMVKKYEEVWETLFSKKRKKITLPLGKQASKKSQGKLSQLV